MNILLSHYVCFDSKVVLGNCDLILWFSDFALYFGTQMEYEHHKMVVYDNFFDPKVVLSRCGLISWFSNFALYLDTQSVYFHTSFR